MAPVRVGWAVVVRVLVEGWLVVVRLDCVALVLRVLVVGCVVVVRLDCVAVVLRVLVALVLFVPVVVRAAPDCSTACCN